jgi:hypothetical protein
VIFGVERVLVALIYLNSMLVPYFVFCLLGGFALEKEKERGEGGRFGRKFYMPLSSIWIKQ